MNETPASKSPLDTFDHVVVLMLENRSFDNLLGYLYRPEDIKPDFPLGKTFAGLHFGGPYGNPIPKDASGKHAGEMLYTMRASDYFQPYPDPGEFYPHVNTQLFGTINPASNEGKEDKEIVAPYNLPGIVPLDPPMNGFVADYISVLRSLKKPGCLANLLRLDPKWFKLNDRYEDYKSIMECFEPEQLPVMATLAKEFAVFDHWHCDVPSQTYTNRAFWHSGSSFGYVNNSPMSNWIFPKNGPTLFNRLHDKGLPWKIYSDNPVSLTGIVHFHALLDYHRTHFKSFSQFLDDAENGNLPAYSFVEPRFFTPHNDQHPSSYDSELYGASTVGAVWLGEKLIWDVYNAIKTSHSPKGNNWKNTLLIITHDEHGGCFDHVAPSPATVVSPDVPPVPRQQGFMFDRLGVRVPMIMISAHIKPNTIVNNDYRHTSFLKTMCDKWGLASFTDRDATAPEFTEVFTSDAQREVQDWPVIPEPMIPLGWHDIDFSNAPLNDLQKAMLVSVAHWKGTSLSEAESMNTAKEAMQYLARFEEELPGAKMKELTYQWKLD